MGGSDHGVVVERRRRCSGVHHSRQDARLIRMSHDTVTEESPDVLSSAAAETDLMANEINGGTLNY